jgi:NADPH:quinone reductase-like Zn-dependent oxidoreductase
MRASIPSPRQVGIKRALGSGALRGIAINEFGGPERMELMELPDPLVGPDVVVIDVKAAGVNPADYKIRAGGMETRYVHHFPVGIGWDAAGVVEAVGPAVRSFAPGDEVFAYCRKTDISDGTYAEKIAVPRTQVALKPESASFVEAGAVPLAALTAWECLTEALELRSGESILVTAGAGGVGHFAVQLARALGAEVFATASPAKHDFVRELGATEVVDYAAGGVAEAVGSVDTVFDIVGGDSQADARAALHEGGRIVSIVDPTVKEAEGVQGFYVFVRQDGGNLRELARRYDAGEFRVEIAETFPLERAADAHRLLEEGHVRGKLVIEIE